MTAQGPFSAASSRYLDKVERRVLASAPKLVGALVTELVHTQDAWRGLCLNLNPAETLMSRGCRRLLDSDLAGRITEGAPGDKLYPHGSANRFIDEIEAIAIAYARRQFAARFVEWRPVSATMASAAVYHAFLKPGDLLLSQDENTGGNYAYQQHGAAGLTGARVAPIPSRGEAFEIDVEALAALVDASAPRMIVVGGSHVLFPYPLREIRRIADRVGALVVYDAAHVGLLISQGDFQRPLEEGAHVVILTSAKIMGGPIGGLVLTNDAGLADAIGRLTFPALLQKRDMNKTAALAFSLAETAQFGRDRARQSVANAQALAGDLAAEGFEVLAAERGYTRTHQVFLKLGAAAQVFETRCNDANILLTDCSLTGDMAMGVRTGARLGVHEVTRLDMKEPEMKLIARLIRRAFDGEAPDVVAADAAQLLSRHQQIAYSFDHDA